MKTVMKKTVAMMIAVFAMTLLAACGGDDYDHPKEFTYTFDTSHMTLSEGSPCTLDQIAQDFKYYFDKGCETEHYQDLVLQDIILTTYRSQYARGWAKYYHGYGIIVCHHYSLPNELTPMYKFDFDANKLIEIPLKY